MRKILRHILFFATAVTLFAACEKDDTFTLPDTSDTSFPTAEAGEVRLVLADGTTRAPFEGMTRAMLDAVGNLLWQSGDRFRLYAHNSDGSNAFSANPYIDFSYWVNTTTPGRSFFRGKMDADMAAGSYSYYAVYPHSTPVSGTVATYTLPAVQDGTYGKTDFMVAKSTASALQRITDADPTTPEPINDISLTFRHQLHAMRFEIPSTGALSSGVRRVHILFSEAVVGDIAVDMASGSVTTSNVGNKITVDFGEGNEKQAGDTFWVMTLPQAAFSRAVDIRFEDSAGNYSTRQLVTFPSSPSSQQYTAGRLTPVKINVPSQTVGYTYLDATTVDTLLGEPVTHLHLDLPEGYYFTDYSNVKAVAENSNNGVHTFTLFNDVIDATFRNSNITLTYESEHALIPTPVVFGEGLQIGKRNQYYNLQTPWLFEQNFDNATPLDSNQDDAALSGELEGWTASRFGVNKAMMMHIYQGTSTSSINNLRARIDSPVLSYLKPTAKVSVKVVCNYGGTTASGVLGKKMISIMEMGTTLTAGIINHKIDLDNKYFSNDAGSNGSYSNTPSTATMTISNFTAEHRISWRGTFRNDNGAGAVTAKHVYVYIDNVRVSIVQ